MEGRSIRHKGKDIRSKFLSLFPSLEIPFIEGREMLIGQVKEFGRLL